MAFYLLIQPIFLSTCCQPGTVLDPGTIPNLQYNQNRKVIGGKLLIIECHNKGALSVVMQAQV